MKKIKIFVSGVPIGKRKRVQRMVSVDWEVDSLDAIDIEKKCNQWISESGWKECSVYSVNVFDCTVTNIDGVNIVFENIKASKTYQINRGVK